EIVEEIGHGGMGVVYRAHDTRLNRDVALKVVAESYLAVGSPMAASHERFFREARASSALNHPNICIIYDVGEQDGRPYLVMELLEGQSLKRLINGHPLPIEQVLDYGIQLTSALVEAHSRGILHRDIKPANLFIVRRGQGNGTLKVLDFGLAKRAPLVTDASATNSLGDFTALSHSLTKTGSTTGTVAYMAPEQARGEELDGRADVFAAGVVMYEMATGSPPFFGPSVAEIFAALLAREPEPIRKRAPHFPREVERVILKALVKDKNRRYASAAELLADLERARFELLGTTGATGSSSAVFAIARRRRNLRRWITVGIAAVLLASAAWFTLRHWPATPPPKVAQVDAIIVSEFANRTGDPAFDVALKQALTGWLQQSPSLNVVSESHLRRSLFYLGKPADQPITLPIAREIAEREGDKAVINGTIASIGNQYVITLEAQSPATGDVIARAQKQADGKDKVLDTLHAASDDLRKNLGESLASIQKLDVPRNEATTPSLDAFRAYAMGQRQAAQANFAESIRFYKQAIELDPNFAMAYANLGIAYVALGNETLANEAITRAFQLSDKVSERERLFIRAHYYQNVTGDLQQTIDLLRLYRDTYPNDAAVPTQLSVAYIMMGQFELAYEEAKRTLAMNARSGSARGNAILALTALGRFQEAKAIFDDAKSLNLADDASIRGAYIYTAYLMGDEAAVRQQVEWSRGQPDGFILNSQLALIHENEGRFATAATDWQLAIARLTDQKLINSTATLIAQQTLDRALVGNCDDVAPRLDRSLKLDQERTMQGTAAIAFALCGQPARAMAIRQSLAKTYPEDTIINHVFLPDIDAAISLREGHADDALKALLPALDYDILGIGSYLRGLAHLDLKQGAEAATDFSFPATHRSAFVLCQVQGMNVAYPLSLLGLARASVLRGDMAKARQQYQAFFDYWKQADADLMPLKEAHAEAARLGP
ncbi:MAG TPA: serine/threonine-protein kinase, partial [Silvibacterium sp.]|nr:serine/threonine-protein kinase [Silvibacterium sp.]